MARRVRRDQAERDELFLANRRLVFKMVNQLFQSYPFARRLGFQDAVSIGNIALLKAAERWDPARAKFSTAACRYIRNAVMRAAQEEGGVVRTPHHAYRKDHFAELLSRANNPTYLGLDAESLEARENVRAEEEAAFAALKEQVEEVLRSFPKRQAFVLRQRLLCGWTLQEVGKYYGVCRERVRQIEKKGMARLRELLGEGPEE